MLPRLQEQIVPTLEQLAVEEDMLLVLLACLPYEPEQIVLLLSVKDRLSKWRSLHKMLHTNRTRRYRRNTYFNDCERILFDFDMNVTVKVVLSELQNIDKLKLLAEGVKLNPEWFIIGAKAEQTTVVT